MKSILWLLKSGFIHKLYDGMLSTLVKCAKSTNNQLSYCTILAQKLSQIYFKSDCQNCCLRRVSWRNLIQYNFFISLPEILSNNMPLDHIYQLVELLGWRFRIVQLFLSVILIIQNMSQDKQAKQLAEIEAQISGYIEKIDVQNKRIRFLRNDNEQLKQKQQQEQELSQQIQEQNAQLRKNNRQLKSKLNEIKKLMQLAKTNNKGPQTIAIKDVIVTHKTVQLDLPKSEVTDEDLQPLKYFPSINSILLSQNHLTDITLLSISDNMIQLRKLFLNNNLITSQGVKNIHKLSNLILLDLRVNKIGDQGVKYIFRLQKLTNLAISNNDITDNGLDGIQNLVNLKYLDLTSNQIANKGGLAVCKCKELSNLYMSHNQVQAIVGIRLLSDLLQLQVLDLRFNSINKDEKDSLKNNVKNSTTLFV